MTTRRGRRLDLPSAFEMRTMLDSGETMASLARRYGCGKNTIRGRLDSAGLLRRRNASASEPEPPPRLMFKPQPWVDQALCAQTDPEVFFPEKGGSTREAKRVCARCPVRAECLDAALTNGERFGIWGGLSERERRNLEKQRHGDAA